MTTVEANARLTSSAGIVLFVLFAAIGVTILAIRRLFFPHLFIGFLLIPPVAVKLASTGYRFFRYYSGDARYRAAGPPLLELRLLAPVVVISTVAVLGTGVALWLDRSDNGWLGRSWLSWHKLSFIVWIFATGVHVLAYFTRAGELGLADFLPDHRVAGAPIRQGIVAAGVILGLVLSVALLGVRSIGAPS